MKPEPSRPPLGVETLVGFTFPEVGNPSWIIVQDNRVDAIHDNLTLSGLVADFHQLLNQSVEVLAIEVDLVEVRWP